METTVRFQTLPVGAIAQYRKVGRVEILDNSDAAGASWVDVYTVRFLTGPRRYKEGTHRVWLPSPNMVQ